MCSSVSEVPVQDTSLRSAGTLSPVASRTRSPGTSSLAWGRGQGGHGHPPVGQAARQAHLEDLLPAVTHADTGWRHQLLQLLQGLLAPVLHDEGHRHNYHDGQGDRGGVVELLHEHADEGRAEQQDDERVLELLQVFLPDRLLGLGVELIEAKGVVALLSLAGRQTLLAGGRRRRKGGGKSR